MPIESISAAVGLSSGVAPQKFVRETGPEAEVRNERFPEFCGLGQICARRLRGGLAPSCAAESVLTAQAERAEHSVDPRKVATP
jgi:hypothetical protein